MIKLINDGNKTQLNLISRSVNLTFGDCIYESYDFEWAGLCREILLPGGIFMVQTDYHTAAEWKVYLDGLFGRENLVNWISVQYDWGGRSRKCFAKKTDFILIYSNGKDYKFYPERVLIPKATAGTNLDKKGTGLKIPTDFWSDMSFSTIAKERVKDSTGKNIQWQKSLRQMNRLLLPFSDESDLIVDPFLGSGTTALWCALNNRNFIGIESDSEVYEVARKRLQEFL